MLYVRASHTIDLLDTILLCCVCTLHAIIHYTSHIVIIYSTRIVLFWFMLCGIYRSHNVSDLTVNSTYKTFHLSLNLCSLNVSCWQTSKHKNMTAKICRHKCYDVGGGGGAGVGVIKITRTLAKRSYPAPILTVFLPLISLLLPLSSLFCPGSSWLPPGCLRSFLWVMLYVIAEHSRSFPRGPSWSHVVTCPWLLWCRTWLTTQKSRV